MTSTYPKEIQTSQLTEMFNGINNLSSLDLNRFILTHKKHETQKKNYKSNLCFKINEQNIKKTKFGININIPSKLLKDYLQNGQIINASLDFSLSNLSTLMSILSPGKFGETKNTSPPFLNISSDVFCCPFEGELCKTQSSPR